MKFDNKIKLPVRIQPCPIAEAIVELRFESNVPHEVMVGFVYKKFNTRYKNLNILPIRQLPVDFIESQPNLQYSPHYSLHSSDYTFQIGPRCFSVVSKNDYKGWKSFYDEIKWVFNQMKELEIIKKPIRLGVRYVNFFNAINIFENIKMDLKLGGNSLIGNVNNVRTEFDIDKLHCIYQITNNSFLQNDQKGSCLDIDLIFENSFDIDDCDTLISAAHELEKKLFFGVLKEEFLGTLNPEY